jgi:hypothetical protein
MEEKKLMSGKAAVELFQLDDKHPPEELEAIRLLGDYSTAILSSNPAVWEHSIRHTLVGTVALAVSLAPIGFGLAEVKVILEALIEKIQETIDE